MINKCRHLTSIKLELDRAAAKRLNLNGKRLSRDWFFCSVWLIAPAAAWLYVPGEISNGNEERKLTKIPRNVYHVNTKRVNFCLIRAHLPCKVLITIASVARTLEREPNNRRR